MDTQGDELTSFVGPSEVFPGQICVLVLSVAAKIRIVVHAVETN